jgi:methylaspartate mutase epsilon subunit
MRVLSDPLAQHIQLDEVDSFLTSLPSGRFPRNVYDHRDSLSLLQPRGGVPLFDAQLELTRTLDNAGADFIPLTIDSYTRHNQYETAAELLSRSELEGKNYLNGYPLVAHGFELTRELYRGLSKPISLRHGTPDARLLAEVAIASGIVEIEGGGICYCVPYSDGFPLDRALLYWQYVDRICAISSKPGAPVHRESFGPLTATLVPPAVALAVEIIEALLAAEQGVLSFAVSFGQTGSIVQDIACARVLRALAREYLDRYGFETTHLDLVYHQWMGQFPPDRDRAASLISGSAFIANLIGADKIVVKTVDEALGVPDPETNAAAVDAVRYLLKTFAGLEPMTSPQIEQEMCLVESETRTLMEAIFDLPGTCFWESAYQAFRRGYLDIPFSPHVDNANRLVSVRDANRSIRIADPGKMPISAADRSTEERILRASPHTSDMAYQQLLRDINIMV